MASVNLEPRACERGNSCPQWIYVGCRNRLVSVHDAFGARVNGGIRSLHRNRSVDSMAKRPAVDYRRYSRAAILWSCLPALGGFVSGTMILSELLRESLLLLGIVVMLIAVAIHTAYSLSVDQAV